MREEFSAPTPPLAIPQRLQRSYPEFRSLDLKCTGVLEYASR